MSETNSTALQLEDAQDYGEYPHFFEVQLDSFGGPIDLLLHLVKSNELPLDELSLAQVTEQYLECLERMKNFDLEIAGEYLVIAATLLSLKSSLLLGRPIEPVVNEDGDMVNPHDELLRRLREAAVFKEGAEKIASLPQLSRDVFSSERKRLKGIKPVLQFRPHDPILLGKAFREILAEAGELNQQTYNVELESISIVDRMMSVLKALENAEEGLSMRALIPDLRSRLEIVGTFISLLELCKRQVIHVFQDEEFGEIRIKSVQKGSSSDEFDELPLESEFDQPAAKIAANDYSSLSSAEGGEQ